MPITGLSNQDIAKYENQKAPLLEIDPAKFDRKSGDFTDEGGILPAFLVVENSGAIYLQKFSAARASFHADADGKAVCWEGGYVVAIPGDLSGPGIAKGLRVLAERFKTPEDIHENEMTPPEQIAFMAGCFKGTDPDELIDFSLQDSVRVYGLARLDHIEPVVNDSGDRLVPANATDSEMELIAQDVARRHGDVEAGYGYAIVELAMGMSALDAVRFVRDLNAEEIGVPFGNGAPNLKAGDAEAIDKAWRAVHTKELTGWPLDRRGDFIAEIAFERLPAKPAKPGLAGIPETFLSLGTQLLHPRKDILPHDAEGDALVNLLTKFIPKDTAFNQPISLRWNTATRSLEVSDFAIERQVIVTSNAHFSFSTVVMSGGLSQAETAAAELVQDGVRTLESLGAPLNSTVVFEHGKKPVLNAPELAARLGGDEGAIRAATAALHEAASFISSTNPKTTEFRTEVAISVFPEARWIEACSSTTREVLRERTCAACLRPAKGENEVVSVSNSI